MAVNVLHVVCFGRLQELEETKGWETHTAETRAAAHNCTIRSCARGGMLEEALALLEKTSQLKVDVHYPTVRMRSASSFVPFLSGAQGPHSYISNVWPKAVPTGKSKCMASRQTVQAPNTVSLHHVVEVTLGMTSAAGDMRVFGVSM